MMGVIPALGLVSWEWRPFPLVDGPAAFLLPSPSSRWIRDTWGAVNDPRSAVVLGAALFGSSDVSLIPYKLYFSLIC